MTGLVRARAVVAKLGMDAHWRGAIVVANALRDAGLEVVYLGHASAQEIAAVSIEEDVELVGLSTLSGNHLEEVPAAVEALRSARSTAVVVVGGAIPPRDRESLREAGVAAVFPTGSALPTIVSEVRELLLAARTVSPGGDDVTLCAIPRDLPSRRT